MLAKDWSVLVPIITLVVIVVGLAHGITRSVRSQRRLEAQNPPRAQKDGTREPTLRE